MAKKLEAFLVAKFISSTFGRSYGPFCASYQCIKSSTFGFYVILNSQDHIGAGPQYFATWGNPWNQGHVGHSSSAVKYSSFGQLVLLVEGHTTVPF